ncbi:MAG: DUF4345 domain-containing protein [Chromatiales bacterium]|jgi:hypothetical protein|nr:DUF4345 domain-containing protein [Chromatiales bacterium]MDH4029277.1 DUF4345 domain-containing protein [Chromatiales bacterium]
MGTCLSRPFLYLCGILYLGFGLWVLLDPHSGAASLASADTGGTLMDVSGTHGGFNVAVGLFMLFAAGTPAWHRPGLLLVALMNGGYLAGRLIELALYGPQSNVLVAVMALEIVLCAVAVSMAVRGRVVAVR